MTGAVEQKAAAWMLLLLLLLALLLPWRLGSAELTERIQVVADRPAHCSCPSILQLRHS